MCALCAKTVPSAFSHRLDLRAQGCSAGVCGGVPLKPVRVISEVDHGDNRAPEGAGERRWGMEDKV